MTLEREADVFGGERRQRQDLWLAEGDGGRWCHVWSWVGGEAAHRVSAAWAVRTLWIQSLVKKTFFGRRKWEMLRRRPCGQWDLSACPDAGFTYFSKRRVKCLSCMFQLNVFLRRLWNVWSRKTETGGRFGFHAEPIATPEKWHTVDPWREVVPEIVPLVQTSTCWPVQGHAVWPAHRASVSTSPRGIYFPFFRFWISRLFCVLIFILSLLCMENRLYTNRFILK